MTGAQKPNEELFRQTMAVAMERVLQSQEASRGVIEAARGQAEAILVAAREAARQIALRTDRRISSIQKERASRLKKESASLLRKERLKAQRARTERPPVDLAATARQLACQLTATEARKP